MFVDSSAFVALLANEPDAPRLANAIAGSQMRYTSGLVRLETVMRTASKLRVSVEDAQQAFDAILTEASIEVVQITDAMARTAVNAFSQYGKGRGHPAQLNLADCMAYAAAKAYQCPLLFIGNDFSKTDLASGLIDPSPQSPR